MNLDNFNFQRGGCDAAGYEPQGPGAATLSGPDGYVRGDPWGVSTFRLALVHELRAPLQVLQGHLDALCDDVGRADGPCGPVGPVGSVGPEGADSSGGGVGAMAPRERLGAMRNMLGVVASAVDDVLQLGQGGVPELPLRASVFEVRACLDEEIELFAGAARAKGLVLECHIAGDVPVTMRADAARLRQILRTLLDNALKYTVCGGIAIRASWNATPDAATSAVDPASLGRRREGESGQLTIHVSDTGPGIPAGMENAVFAAFARADRSVPGTGLGLWIAQQWAQRMGGSLCVEPSTTGARFRLSVPFVMPCASPRAGVADAAVRRGNAPTAAVPVVPVVPVAPVVPAVPAVRVDVRSGLLALVVDDHVMNRAILTDQLTSLGCIVKSAEDLTDALLQWTSHDVDVVLTDVQLGDASGLTLAKALRALAPVLGRRAPVVFAVTGSVVGARAAREAGIDDVLTKPVSRQRLAQTLAVRWPCMKDAPVAPSGTAERPKARRPSLADDPYARRMMRDEMAKDLARFRRLIATRRAEDIDAAQALLHRMRGACRMFGDPSLTARCDRLSEKLAEVRVAPGAQR